MRLFKTREEKRRGSLAQDTRKKTALSHLDVWDALHVSDAHQASDRLHAAHAGRAPGVRSIALALARNLAHHQARYPLPDARPRSTARDRDVSRETLRRHSMRGRLTQEAQPAHMIHQRDLSSTTVRLRRAPLNQRSFTPNVSSSTGMRSTVCSYDACRAHAPASRFRACAGAPLLRVC